MLTHDYTFRAATPVWEKGTAKVMNRTVCFVATLPATNQPVKLVAAASCSFLLTVNGAYVAHGPARCCHGYFRVDEYDLSKYLTKDVNTVALRVASYNVNAFSYLNQPGFLCAEITVGGEIVAATGADGFKAYPVTERVQKVQRYSFQRTFVETYKLSEGAFDYEINPNTAVAPVEVEPAVAGHFLCRDIPMGEEDEPVYPVSVIHRGQLSYSEKEHYYNSREIGDIGPHYLAYRENELEYASHREVGKCDPHGQVDVTETANTIALAADTYADIEFPCNTTGIYEFDLEARGDGELFIIFDEILLDGQVRPFRLGLSNIITVMAKAGKYHLECAMPHVMKYARIMAKGTAMTVRGLYLHHIAFPTSAITASFAGNDETMKRIYDAALETYRANSVDIYMDCPSRERAGWLCDSFFTSRVEYALTGKSQLERAFLQCFILPESFEFIPKGMLPMCYPADHYDKTYIPNWAMWYAVELCEYFTRTGDREFVDGAKDKMYALMDFFKKYENEYGLLENLESWVFLEWSKSNELTQDVSFASNMLYAYMLEGLGKLYSDEALIAKAAALKAVINELSMTESGFYCDNAYRRDGKLVLSGERTESCQYYAFFCGTATPETHPWLWNTLVHDFGYARAEKGLYPEIWPANAFIGNYLRLDLLDRFGLKDELYDNIKGYFTYMADTTGTLWELVASQASCNHGFASHVIHWMDSLGLLSHR
ncbi:MAG: hypothetical protein J6K29_07665 [Clostridia bacterium]|nr:hypothetical protein [Clostridia bacterium]